MRNTCILHSINPEIDRTYHRLVRQNRTLDTNFVSVSEHHVAEYSDSVHSVAFPNFDHSVHSENMAQPPTPPARQDKLETKIDSLTTLITQLAINQQKSSMARVCGICTSSDHYSDMCPSLLEPRTGDHPEAYVANIYNNRPPHKQQHYDPLSSSTYNRGWRNQAPFQNNNVGQNRSSYMPPSIQQQRHQMINTPAPTEPSLEELFQQETKASIQRQESSIQNLTTQMGQMATSLNTLQSQNSDKLPSQTVLNPRNVSAITLRSGKQTEVPTPRIDFGLQKEHDASKRNKSFNDTHLSNFLHDFHAPSLTDSYTCHACTNSETCSFCIDEFLNIDIDIDVPCTSLYTCHACTDSERCDSCIDEFLNIVVDSPVTHSHCTNTIDAGITQQSDLFVQVQAATKPSFATFFPSVLQAPDWTPPFDLECDIAVYALGIVLASYEFDFLPP
ncbi:hypothetical protein Lal_00015581 [Lupinus albus]|nr:hypothetical protein Lal_00015581 [Lupinus albus]